jgi:hemerythrin-like domain-containing protein
LIPFDPVNELGIRLRMPTDAIALLKEDHRAVETLFKKYEKLGERAAKTKHSTVEKIIRLLSVPAAVEETVFYPYVRENAPALNSTVLEALEEHLVAKWELAALENMTPADERFDAKVSVLTESVRHHVKEEEKELFPKLRQVLSRGDLQELGTALARAKKTAPTHPHPRSPDAPPGNVPSSMAAAVVDRARDLGKEAIDKVRERV